MNISVMPIEGGGTRRLCGRRGLVVRGVRTPLLTQLSTSTQRRRYFILARQIHLLLRHKGRPQGKYNLFSFPSVLDVLNPLPRHPSHTSRGKFDYNPSRERGGKLKYWRKVGVSRTGLVLVKSSLKVWDI